MKKTGFLRLFIRSLPEIWFCQVVIGEICAPIFLSDAIQKQEKTGVFSIIKKSVMAIPRFITEVIEKNIAYSALYGVVLFALTLLGLIHILYFMAFCSTGIVRGMLCAGPDSIL